MGKIFVIMGKSATGKDTIYQRVAEDLRDSLKEIVLYTTRPIRDQEENGKQYHFVSEEEYVCLKEQGKIIEERAYDTMYGIWRYFTVNDEQLQIENQSYIMIGTLEAYQQIKNYFGEEIVVPIYITVETGERLQRALSRERKQTQPKYTEMCRRFIADEEDFSKENIQKAQITKCYYNDEITGCVAQIEADIQSML